MRVSGEGGALFFIEHCLFKGTEKGKHIILNRLERVGGELNAYTQEETWISASFLERDLRRAVELVTDITFNSTFPEKEIAKRARCDS